MTSLKRITPSDALELLAICQLASTDNTPITVIDHGVTENEDNVFVSIKVGKSQIPFFEGDNTDIVVENDTIYLISEDGDEYRFALKYPLLSSWSSQRHVSVTTDTQ